MIRAALILAGVLVAGGGIVACGGDDSDGSTHGASVELPAEVVEAYDNYTEALLAGDGEAMLEFVTDDFTWLSYGTNLMDAEYRADYVTRYYSRELRSRGDRRTNRGWRGDEYIFSVPERAVTPAIADGISLVKMVEVDDRWLVSAHRFLGEGEGSG